MFHPDPNSKTGKVALVLGVPLFALFLYFQVQGFQLSLRSLSWPETRGVVMTSAKKTKISHHGAHDTAKIVYAYTVGQETYRSENVSFGFFRGMLTWGHARRQVEEFPAGKVVTVFYDPRSPGVACLRRGGVGWEDLLMLPVCVAGIIMGLKLLFTFLAGLGPVSEEPPADPDDPFRL